MLNFDQFQGKQHLATAPVGSLENLLGQLNDFGVIPDHQGVKLFMNVDLAQLQHGPEQVDSLFRIDVGEIEGLNDLVFVLFFFVFGLGVQDDRFRIQHPHGHIVHLQ